MKDQVQQLVKRNISAVALYSGLRQNEMDRLLDNCTYGQVKFLYISPERLFTERFLIRLLQLPVTLIAVDEAHCISQWGYDFRPAYLKIADIRTHFPKVPILALTATATPEVAQDIQHKLDFKNPEVFKDSFTRDNLSLVVRKTEDKERECLKILQKLNGSAIIYVRNRKKTKDLAAFLITNRISADFYHAGLSMEERSTKQDLWIQNKIRVMVTTNAFGMGIDKPDVRLVIHWELPDNPEAYYQEAGRAGQIGRAHV
jgi:ATP-dependent DNA helicase RecQ